MHTGQGLDSAFIGKMNDTNNEIIKIVQEVAPKYLRLLNADEVLSPHLFKEDDGTPKEEAKKAE